MKHLRNYLFSSILIFGHSFNKYLLSFHGICGERSVVIQTFTRNSSLVRKTGSQ